MCFQIIKYDSPFLLFSVSCAPKLRVNANELLGTPHHLPPLFPLFCQVNKVTYVPNKYQ